MRSAAKWAALLLALARPVVAQELRGIVLSDDAGAVVTAATLTLVDDAGRVVARGASGDDGRFDLRAPTGGSFRLNVERLGFVSWTSAPIHVADQGRVELEIRLGVSAVPLDPLRVVSSAARAGTPGSSGAGMRITREEIERSGAVRASEVLRPLPGITLRPVADAARPSGDGRHLVQMRQGTLSECYAAVFVDGVFSPQSTTLTIDDYVDPATLEAVDLYPSNLEAPPQYQRSDACGAILFWTRSGRHTDRATFSWIRLAIGAGLIGLTWIVGR